MKRIAIMALTLLLALFASFAEGVRRGGFLSTTGSFQLSSGGGLDRRRDGDHRR